MAALCPGVQYGLSSQQNYGENRDLIFVKLTDSALRAIEEHLKNQGLSNEKPTIKFLGNENGELCFPGTHHQQGHTSFTFSISSTADMGGSFECIKQSGPPKGPLEGLGSIPHKLRIHANDDVYEVTRTRMTEAEDKYKNKCTRVIKPNQKDIGRKVKVKQMPGRPPLHTVHPTHQPRREMLSMRDSLLKQPSQPSTQVSRPPPPQQQHYQQLQQQQPANLHSSTASSARAKIEGSRRVETPRRPMSRKPPPPASHNLTPPGGSDGGSSGSSHSPSSTHPGSPPPPSTHHPAAVLPVLTTATKRPGFHEGPDGFPYKRQRIAHNAVKPTPPPPPPVTEQQPAFEGNGQRRPVTDSRDTSNMNPRSRENPANTGYHFTNGHQQSSNGYHHHQQQQSSNGYQQPSNTYHQPPNPYKHTSNGHSQQTNGYHNHQSNGYQQPSNGYQNQSNGYQQPSNGCLPPSQERQLQLSSSDDDDDDEDRVHPEPKRERSAEREQNSRLSNGKVRPNCDREVERPAKYSKVSSSDNNNRAILRVSPERQPDAVEDHVPLVIPNADVENVEKENFPDYRQLYSTIKDAVQRKKYKDEFNKDYDEYRELHLIVERISRKFAILEERLNQEVADSPRYIDIRHQIVCEYEESKKDASQSRAKHRFQYLHNKLSYIKRLIVEYDRRMASSRN